MKKIGIVLSVKHEKTKNIFIKSIKKHKKYNKYIYIYKKLLVHDTNNISKKGDIVEIKHVRPLSKKKRYIIIKILKN